MSPKTIKQEIYEILESFEKVEGVSKLWLSNNLSVLEERSIKLEKIGKKRKDSGIDRYAGIPERFFKEFGGRSHIPVAFEKENVSDI
jgi:hypothetical protein